MGFVNFGKKSDDKTLAGLIDRSLTNITINTNVGKYAFYGCTNLKSVVILDGVTVIGSNAFNGCSNLEYVKLPQSVITISSYAFGGCSKLQSVDLQNVTFFADNAFNSALLLKTLKVNVKTTFGGNALRNSKIETLVLTNDKMSILQGTLGTNTPITDGTGYIYVPGALLDDYKTATNWVTYADQFRAIEDYQEVLEANNND